MYLQNHRVVVNGAPLDAQHTNVALEVRKAGYHPALLGYTDTGADPRRQGDAVRGQQVDAFTENVDIMPTILDCLGLDVPVQCDGELFRSRCFPKTVQDRILNTRLCRSSSANLSLNARVNGGPCHLALSLWEQLNLDTLAQRAPGWSASCTGTTTSTATVRCDLLRPVSAIAGGTARSCVAVTKYTSRHGGATRNAGRARREFGLQRMRCL
jgi:hypothetical protein